MLPLFFGTSDEPLFGVYEAPRRSTRSEMVLVLNPTGWEYLRAHRALRVLSTRLAEQGFDVFRFDYSGTGDSWGNEDDATLDRWLQDAVTAADELQALSGTASLHLVGVRLGARLAHVLLAERHLSAASAVLWDPPRLDVSYTDMGAPQSDGDGTPLALSIPVSIATAVLQRASAPLPDLLPALIVTSMYAPVPEDLASGAAVQAVPLGVAPCWVEQAHHGAGPISQPVIERIVEWLAR